jgi:hypothetical protein
LKHSLSAVVLAYTQVVLSEDSDLPNDDIPTPPPGWVRADHFEDARPKRYGTSRASAAALGTGQPTGFAPSVVDRTNARLADATGNPTTGDSVLDRLPPDARQKLTRLRAAAADQTAVQRALMDQRNDAVTQRQAAGQRLRVLEQDITVQRGAVGLPGHSPGPQTEHPSITQAKADMARAAATIAELDERLAKLRSEGRTVLPRIESWLRSLPRSIVLEPAPPVKLPSKQAPLAVAEAARTRITELRAELRAVSDAPEPSSVTKARLLSELDVLAARGAPDIRRSIEYGQPLAIGPTRLQQATIHGHVVAPDAPVIAGFSHVAVFDHEAAHAWANRAMLAQHIEAEVAALCDDTGAITAEDKGARSTEIRAAILEAERTEEAAIEAAGGTITRRPDMDPRACLGLSDQLPGVD